MALTKKERKEIEDIRNEVKRAVVYLRRTDVVGIAKKVQYPNGADYRINNAACLTTCANVYENIRITNHLIGSDICGVYFALDALDRFLNPDKVKHEAALFDEGDEF